MMEEGVCECCISLLWTLPRSQFCNGNHSPRISKWFGPPLLQMRNVFRPLNICILSRQWPPIQIAQRTWLFLCSRLLLRARYDPFTQLVSFFTTDSGLEPCKDIIGYLKSQWNYLMLFWESQLYSILKEAKGKTWYPTISWRFGSIKTRYQY